MSVCSDVNDGKIDHLVKVVLPNHSWEGTVFSL